MVQHSTLLLTLLSISIYLHPLTLSRTPSSPSSHPFNLITRPKPQLDEVHIMSLQNYDVTPPLRSAASSTTDDNDNNNNNDNDNNNNESRPQWLQAWHNDYWGRPLNSDTSHKSWRPLSIWSFRFLKGNNSTCRFVFGFIGRVVGVLVESLLRVVHFNRDGDGVNDDGVEEWSLMVLWKNVVYQREGTTTSELFVHRLMNVWIHVVLVHLVGVVARLFFAPIIVSNSASNVATGKSADNATLTNEDGTTNTIQQQQHQLQQKLLQYTQYTAQILFAIHPTHVETVANIANRPHLLALLFNVTIIDPTIPFLAVGILSAAGLLSAETGIFQLPAVCLSMLLVMLRKELGGVMVVDGGEMVDESPSSTSSSSTTSPSSSEKESSSPQQQLQLPSSFQLLLQTFIKLLPRYILLLITCSSYLLYRYTNGSLDIPDGLIRPAENPFYHKLDNGEWTFLHRVVNYSYILSLHVFKSLGVEWIGFSHEYGFDCIPAIELPIVRRTSSSSVWTMDLRVLLPVGLVGMLCGLIIWAWYGVGVKNYRRYGQLQQQHDRTIRILLVLTLCAWLATLFPIAGFLKVGTFVADRLVVASTFGTCIFGGRLIAVWLTADDDDEHDDDSPSLAIRPKTIVKHTLLLYLFTHLAKQTHNRTADWMDEFSLLNSSLKTCPRSIKSNLEASKLYSGLVPQMTDFDKALSLIKTAQSIDPTYCDVHMQYAHVYFQQEKYLPFEQELVEALLCQFTMGQAMNNWNRYWQVMLSTGGDEAKERYTRYMQRIQLEVAKAEEEDASKAKKKGTIDRII